MGAWLACVVVVGLWAAVSAAGEPSDAGPRRGRDAGTGRPGGGAATTAPDADALVVGMPAPNFVLRTLNAEQSGMTAVSTRAMFGPEPTAPARALVLDFAASYCEPCKRELPALDALAARYRGRGVVWAVVLIDRDDAGRDAMRTWMVDVLAFAHPVLADRFALLARRYGVNELPHLVLIDGGGTVRWIRAGFRDDTLSTLEGELGRLLGPVPVAESAAPGAPTP